jgi:hypothetical protein
MRSVPVALFTYVRSATLERTLACLRENGVGLLYAFSDGAKSPEHAADVEGVREMLRAIDWAEVRLRERPENLGLGRSIRAGVDEVLAAHDSVIVFEDDLVCAPGTYAYLCSALERYRDAPSVLSVTGWTHPRVTPRRVDGPYFDGRAECLVWGTWRRAWRGMERDALAHMQDAAARGIDPHRYGDDLVDMARGERARNIWAVRWSFLHIAQRGLCLRPPRSLVDHLGLDQHASNAGTEFFWANPSIGPAPEPPIRWPDPVEHPDCSRLWRRACGRAGGIRHTLTNLLAGLLHRR